MTRVAVCSRSFSAHQVLRAELLAKYPNARFNDDGISLIGEHLIDFLSDADKAIVALEVLDQDTIARLPNLQIIGKYGVGLDKLDLSALAAAGIQLGWTAGVNSRSVAELVIVLAISLLRQIPFATHEIKERRWRQQVGRQLSGQTVGIVGCGHVGTDLVRQLQPFGCRILAHDIIDQTAFYTEFGVEPMALDPLLEQADFVSLHIPLDPSTRNLMSRDRRGLMKSDGVLINTARGGILDEMALCDRLEQGAMGAACDVFEIEPMYNDRLLSLPNFVATPHIGGSSAEAILAMGRAAIAGLDHSVNATEYLQC